MKKQILGIDEVGRGPWAGPLVIGACVLPATYNSSSNWQDQLTDSKKLTALRREKLSKIILDEAPITSLGWATAAEIDKLGLSLALKLATMRAIIKILQTSGLEISIKTFKNNSQPFSSADLKKLPFTEIIIDGTINFLAGTPLENHVTVLKSADLLIKEVSAASIIAKVARDDYMKKIAKKFPAYGFEKHVGYGTAVHRAALSKYGPTPEHRLSFKPLKNLSSTVLRPTSSSSITTHSTTQLGFRAETIVADFLVRQGHTILARNHKTKFYEIDIVSIKSTYIYFTEVKYRKNTNYGSPLSAITKPKQRQMIFAAQAFIKSYLKKSTHSDLQPVLAVASVSGPDFHLDDWFPLVN